MKTSYNVLLIFLTVIFLPSICRSQTKLVSWTNLSSVDLINIENKVIHLQPTTLAVFILLSPECPLSKNYISVINKLAEDKRVNYYGIVPGASYTSTEVKRFALEFKAGFPILIDKKKKLTHLLNGTITPECILLSQSGKVLYRGLIDNWAYSLGKQRKVITARYLEESINSTLMHKPVQLPRTKPVGCLINDL